jgi:chromate transport protein ChrA
MLAGLAGLMVPSLAITILLAWAYERISAYPQAQGPLHAVAGIAAGYAVALAIQLFRDILRPAPFVRAGLAFLLFLGLGLWLNNPLLVMGIAIGLALVFPGLLDMVPAPAKEAATDES